MKPNVTIFIIASKRNTKVVTMSKISKYMRTLLYGFISGESKVNVLDDAMMKRVMKNSKHQC